MKKEFNRNDGKTSVNCINAEEFRKCFKKIYGADFNFENSVDCVILAEKLQTISDDELREFYELLLNSRSVDFKNRGDETKLQECLRSEIVRRMNEGRKKWATLLDTVDNLYLNGNSYDAGFGYMLSVEILEHHGKWLNGKSNFKEDDFAVEVTAIIHLDFDDEHFKLPAMRVYLNHYFPYSHNDIKEFLKSYLSDTGNHWEYKDFFEFNPESYRKPYCFQQAYPMFETDMQKLIIWLIHNNWFHN